MSVGPPAGTMPIPGTIASRDPYQVGPRAPEWQLGILGEQPDDPVNGLTRRGEQGLAAPAVKGSFPLPFLHADGAPRGSRGTHRPIFSQAWSDLQELKDRKVDRVGVEGAGDAGRDGADGGGNEGRQHGYLLVIRADGSWPEAPGQVVTRSMLLESVWNYDFEPRGNIIDMHLYRLRQKVDHGFARALIYTVPGAGYMIREPNVGTPNVGTIVNSNL